MTRTATAPFTEHDELQRNYLLAEEHLQAGRLVEAATLFKACLRAPEQVPSDLGEDAFAGWLEALVALGDRRAVDRASRRAEAANALSPLTRELLAEHFQKYGRPTEARRHAKRAIEDLATEFGSLSPEHRFGIALLGTRLALTYVPAAVAAYLERATANVPDELDAHIALLEPRLAAAATLGLVMADEVGELDRALATQEWQAAYDLAMRASLKGFAPLARVLHLAVCLRNQGATEAALDVLGRAVDAHPASQPMYWLLVWLFMDLERYEDALTALEVLQLLQRASRTSHTNHSQQLAA